MTPPRPFETPLYVTRSVLPDFEDFIQACRELWDTRVLTNDGPVLRKLENAIRARWGTDNVMLFANGTIALELACRALGLKGEVITTPFTFPATAHVLTWLGLTPVLCDIDDATLNIDPALAADLITPQTSAIMGVHVFGHPCGVDQLGNLSASANLKLIFDAAHAYGARYNGRPLPTYGDVSMVSLHATKLFHSIEGGILHFADPSLAKTLKRYRNFGIDGEAQINGVGVNAKMSELHAIVGLLLEDKVAQFIEQRSRLARVYAERLAVVEGVRVIAPVPGEEPNYAYQPIRINAKQFGMSRDQLVDALAAFNVIARRYFYPLVSDYACYRGAFETGRLPVARTVASEVMTLPVFPDLTEEDVHRVCDALVWSQRDARSRATVASASS
jgi:dTDP-4-amino-4,6-dideoxygalactose transaminase